MLSFWHFPITKITEGKVIFGGQWIFAKYLGGMKRIRKTRTLELEEATASQPNPMKDKSQKDFEE